MKRSRDIAKHVYRWMADELEQKEGSDFEWVHSPKTFLPANVTCDYAGQQHFINEMAKKIRSAPNYIHPRSEPVKGTCHICDTRGDVKNVNLYVSGSEGVDVCPECDTLLRDFISSLSRHRIRKKIQKRKEKCEREKRAALTRPLPGQKGHIPGTYGKEDHEL